MEPEILPQAPKKVGRPRKNEDEKKLKHQEYMKQYYQEHKEAFRDNYRAKKNGECKETNRTDYNKCEICGVNCINQFCSLHNPMSIELKKVARLKYLQSEKGKEAKRRAYQKQKIQNN